MNINKLLQKIKYKSIAEFENTLIPSQKIIFDNFRRYTKLEESYILSHLNRIKNYQHGDEYKFKKPKTIMQTEWYYRTSEKYIFSLLEHRPWKYIEKVKKGKILDYGGGIGIDSLWLSSKSGFIIDYFDINVIQSDFVKFMLKNQSINNIMVLSPFIANKFDPVNCICDNYDGILLRSVLEHIYYYDELLKHLISKINKGGYIYEASRFGVSKKDPMHIDEKIRVKDLLKSSGFEIIFQSGVHRIWKRH